MGVEDNSHNTIEAEDENDERIARPAQPTFLRAPDHPCVLQTNADFRKDQGVNAEHLGQKRKVLLLDSLLRVQKKSVPTQASMSGNKVQYRCDQSLTYSSEQPDPTDDDIFFAVSLTEHYTDLCFMCLSAATGATSTNTSPHILVMNVALTLTFPRVFFRFSITVRFGIIKPGMYLSYS